MLVDWKGMTPDGIRADGASQLALVIATKDRPQELGRLLSSLARQNPKPAEVIIVDGGDISVVELTRSFRGMPVRYLRHRPPSAARQRNVGVAALGAAACLVGFLDDDTVLPPGAIAAMLQFWATATTEYAGAGFNLLNPVPRGWRRFKTSPLVERLGLYSRRAGGVALSGWQNVVGTVEATCDVDWLGTGASCWRRTVFDEFAFDEHFDGYSYLEDLDFSYSVRRRFRLAIVATAGYRHFPSLTSRLNPDDFGVMESANRLYFVRKHGLSMSRCYVGLAIRCVLSAGNSLLTGDAAGWRRAWGNVRGVFAS